MTGFAWLAARRAVSSRRLTPGSYLTDGWRLLRVISQVRGPRWYRMVLLEDCLTLEVNGYAMGELRNMRLARVPINRRLSPA
ncbi:MAG TPA: hypothetical protein VE127_01180 [Solirubrobacteraceae bacterium]|nr:hypothetical protein [Solirubrobacteraceae bacterium]